MDTDQLLDLIAQGESSAAATLFTRYRKRLHHMVSLRIDPHLAARHDPSDVVQEALAEAHQRLPEYAAKRPIPFYPWLRRIAWERLIRPRCPPTQCDSRRCDGSFGGLRNTAR